MIYYAVVILCEDGALSYANGALLYEHGAFYVMMLFNMKVLFNVKVVTRNFFLKNGLNIDYIEIMKLKQKWIQLESI